MFFNKVIYDQNNNPSEIELICNKCGKYIKVTDIDLFDRIQSEYCIISNGKNIICDECGNSSGDGLVEYKKLTSLPKRDNVIKPQPNTPKCPICNSTNIHKISGTERAVSIIGLGIFSKKINKSFKCNNCGGTF